MSDKIRNGISFKNDIPLDYGLVSRESVQDGTELFVNVFKNTTWLYFRSSEEIEIRNDRKWKK